MGRKEKQEECVAAIMAPNPINNMNNPKKKKKKKPLDASRPLPPINEHRVSRVAQLLKAVPRPHRPKSQPRPTYAPTRTAQPDTRTNNNKSSRPKHSSENDGNTDGNNHHDPNNEDDCNDTQCCRRRLDWLLARISIPYGNNDAVNECDKNTKNASTAEKDDAPYTRCDDLKLLRRWQILFAMGLVLLFLSAVAFVGHAQRLERQRQQNHRDADAARGTTIYWNDDPVQGSTENVFIKENPCGPRSWPELVGVHVNEARDRILRDNVCVVVQIVLVDSEVGSSQAVYDPERVRLYMDPDTGTVAEIPKVG